jgi:hypothetical protein
MEPGPDELGIIMGEARHVLVVKKQYCPELRNYQEKLSANEPARPAKSTRAPPNKKAGAFNPCLDNHGSCNRG